MMERPYDFQLLGTYVDKVMMERPYDFQLLGTYVDKEVVTGIFLPFLATCKLSDQK
jgi:hypothetical protein